MGEQSTSAEDPLHAGLYLVATPIGNLADLTFRALRTLHQADIIACEDTRHSTRLLAHHQVPHKRLLSLNEHNEAKRIPELISAIAEGKSVALVSDAGMPTVSDPGQRLVKGVIEANLHVEVHPGPSAVLAALAGSGLPTTPFYFGGFLPHKKGQRSTELSAALERDHTSIYFESPYRLADSLAMISSLSPERPLVVARELTKVFETYHRGTATHLAAWFEQHPPKGEICLLVSPAVKTKSAKQGNRYPQANLNSPEERLNLFD